MKRPIRHTTDQMIARMLHLVWVAAHSPTTRAALSARWDMTPRNINYLRSRAERLFGVKITHEPGRGYVLMNEGVLDIDELRTFAPWAKGGRRCAR